MEDAENRLMFLGLKESLPPGIRFEDRVADVTFQSLRDMLLTPMSNVPGSLHDKQALDP